MEPIKITDKLTLRQEALRMAVMVIPNDFAKAPNITTWAKEFESYLQGDVELPEYEDTHKDFKEMLTKLQDSFKPKPLLMWNSIPRFDDGTILAPWIDTLRQSIPFCMHDAKHNRNVLVADECEYEIFIDQIMKNPRYDAYCHVDIPPYTPQPTL